MSFGIPTRNGLPLGLGTVASLASRATAAVVSATDTFFRYVTLLLNTSATNGAQNNTFLDSSSNNFSITRNGDTTQGSFNPYMPTGYWSGFFDGTDDRLTVADNAALRPGTGNFTIEAWVFRTASGAAHTIYAKGGASTGFVFQITSGNLLRFTDTTTNIDSTGTVAANTWVHVAVVREGTGANQLKLYINGTNDGQGTVSTNFNQTEELRIGENRGATEDFSGYISNVRFATTAVYTTAFTPPTTPLTAITNTSLLCLQDNRFIDNSTNAFAITVNGDTRISKFAPFNLPVSYSTASYGGSGYFDGTGDYLSVPRNNAFLPGANTDFTVEAWVYLTATPGGSDALIAGLGEYGIDSDWNFNVNSSRQLTFYINAITTSFTNTGTLVPLNTWTHVAASRSGTGANNLKVFVNGVGQSFTTNSTTVGTGSRNLTLGADQNGDESNFTGYISNLRFVNGTGVYTADFTPPTTPLTAITNTSLLLNFTNAGIFDAATINDGQTVGNAQVSTTQAKFGTTSMYFDGTGDYVTVIDKPELRFGTAPFTIEFWLYFTSSGGSTQAVVSKGTSTTGWQVQVSSAEQIEFVFGNLTITSATITPSVWTHVAVVREGTGTNQTKIYVNGTNTGVDTVATNFNQTNPLYVGASRILTQLLYLGYVQDLRITNGVARYTANFTAPTAAFPTL
jgi:hypothetical protein